MYTVSYSAASVYTCVWIVNSRFGREGQCVSAISCSDWSSWWRGIQ